MNPSAPSDTSGARPLVRGLGASAGIATGPVVFRPEDAVLHASRGESVILVRIETSAEDVAGLRAAAGIVTTRGGLTADAAIVARSLGKPCIAGCSGLNVDYASDSASVFVEDANDVSMDRVTLKKGDIVTIDGSKGTLFAGRA
ncbi:MAG: PEP-utilizing enzyme [Polyangiaceae bacterium]